MTWKNSNNAQVQQTPNRSVIIGAGIGGCCSSYFARQQFGASAELVVVEAQNSLHNVGGRTTTRWPFGPRRGSDEFEIGATIIHEKNRYLREFTDKFGLERLRFSSKSDSPEMAILQALGLAASDHKSPWKHTLLYDGERIRWSSLPSDLLTALSLLLRYGADLWRSHLFVSRLLKHFDRIYALQEAGYAYSSVEGLLTAAGKRPLAALLGRSLTSVLHEQGIGDRFTNELVEAATHANYTQEVSRLPAFVGSVSLAGAGSELWAVRGGNRLVAERLLDAARVDTLVLGRHVTHLTRETVGLEEPSGAHKYQKYSARLDDGSLLEGFDLVFLAAPQYAGSDERARGSTPEGNASVSDSEQSQCQPALVSDEPHAELVAASSPIEFKGFSRSSDAIRSELAIPFRRVYVTFVRGDLNRRTSAPFNGFPELEWIPGARQFRGLQVLSVNPEPVFASLAINNNVLGETPGVLPDAPQAQPERDASASSATSASAISPSAAQHPKYPLWKLFSRRPLSEAQLSSFFGERDGPAFRVQFFAYPDFERFCVDSAPARSRRPQTALDADADSGSGAAPAADEQPSEDATSGTRPSWLPPAPVKEKKGVFEHFFGFMADVMEEAADDDTDLGDSGDDDAGDTGSDDGGGDEGGGDMAYDAADREFPGYPDVLFSAQLPHKLNSTRTSEKSPSGSVTFAAVGASSESQQQKQRADVECYRWLPGGVRVDTGDTDAGSRVYYVSRIECAASAMEMAAIGARNAVLLAHYDLLRAATRDGSAEAAAHTDVLYPKL